MPIIATHPAVGITDGPVAVDRAPGVGPLAQTFRQSFFPAALIQQVSCIQVQDASATVQEDKVRILNYIAGRRGAELEAPALPRSQAYEVWNRGLICKHIAAAWRLLLEAGEDMRYGASLLADSDVHKLVLSFRLPRLRRRHVRPACRLAAATPQGVPF